MARKKHKYHYLYKTINKLNGKYYYGMHSTSNLDDGYLGSGKYLRNSIHRHGKENFKKIILEFFDSREELIEAEEKLITKEIVKEDKCMNLCLGGKAGSIGMVSVKDKEGNTFSVFLDDKRYLSGELVGVTTGFVNVKDKDGKTYQVSINDERYLSGELLSVANAIVSVKDKAGNTFSVSINDERYLSGEFISITKGKISVFDENGNNLQVDINDERYLSGELKFNWTGKKHTEETKNKIGKINSIKQKGEGNSQFGKIRSEETKNKIRQKIKDINIKNKIMFYVYDKNMNFISKECGISEYAIKNNISKSGIIGVLKGRNKSAKGLIFSYLLI